MEPGEINHDNKILRIRDRASSHERPDPEGYCLFKPMLNMRVLRSIGRVDGTWPKIGRARHVTAIKWSYAFKREMGCNGWIAIGANDKRKKEEQDCAAGRNGAHTQERELHISSTLGSCDSIVPPESIQNPVMGAHQCCHDLRVLPSNLTGVFERNTVGH
ncbi:hypothetical protein P691DRAFT_364143 [Macrolepiota fuliginosa MF-IS2]|uniref:Uncharacterized protein n=1 Tax=Macrolepiota fuliginosa MF-IS2 TaxID=1400762 RepID=A0A9P5XI65_9AGAR|nr:hypothetical protein P691DRAFT_364143 [Macrolepiota fuliginosa MF-IS2]